MTRHPSHPPEPSLLGTTPQGSKDGRIHLLALTPASSRGPSGPSQPAVSHCQQAHRFAHAHDVWLWVCLGSWVCWWTLVFLSFLPLPCRNDTQPPRPHAGPGKPDNEGMTEAVPISFQAPHECLKYHRPEFIQTGPPLSRATTGYPQRVPRALQVGPAGGTKAGRPSPGGRPWAQTTVTKCPFPRFLKATCIGRLRQRGAGAENRAL